MSLRANEIGVAIQFKPTGLNKRRRRFYGIVESLICYSYYIRNSALQRLAALIKNLTIFYVDCHDLNQSSNLAMTLGLNSGCLKKSKTNGFVRTWRYSRWFLKANFVRSEQIRLLIKFFRLPEIKSIFYFFSSVSSRNSSGIKSSSRKVISLFCPIYAASLCSHKPVSNRI